MFAIKFTLASDVLFRKDAISISNCICKVNICSL